MHDLSDAGYGMSMDTKVRMLRFESRILESFVMEFGRMLHSCMFQ